ALGVDLLGRFTDRRSPGALRALSGDDRLVPAQRVDPDLRHSSRAQRVALYVGFELRHARVWPLADVPPTCAVIEDRDGCERGIGERDPEVAALVVVARIALREAAKKVLRFSTAGL